MNFLFPRNKKTLFTPVKRLFQLFSPASEVVKKKNYLRLMVQRYNKKRNLSIHFVQRL